MKKKNANKNPFKKNHIWRMPKHSLKIMSWECHNVHVVMGVHIIYVCR